MALRVPFQGGTVANPVVLPSGSAATPALNFTAETNTGILFASSMVQFSRAGTAYLGMGTNELAVASGAQVAWASGALGTGTDTVLRRHAASVLRMQASSSSFRCLMGGGASVASAAALPLPTGRVFHVTGTTNVTSITSTNFGAGVVITLIFDGVLTFTDGNNLKLAGNFTTAADSTITLVYDGTNWYEICRSTN